MNNVKCWNCGNDFEVLSSARKIENPRPQMDLSHNEWEYVLNGLSALIDNAYLWGWAGTEVEKDIRNIIDRIEKNIGVE